MFEYNARAARWKKRFAALQRSFTPLFVRSQAPDELERMLQRVR
ncbi:MAG: hypothetical protein PVH54_06845 [Gammaproteobacteria bacterium]